MHRPTDHPFRLVTLGGLALRAADGSEDATLARRRHKLAVLAVLALADRAPSRDALLALFWPEQEEARARHSLSDALSHLRRVLGPRAISTRRAEVGLSDEARIEVDASAFAAAVAAGDHEAAVSLYGGPFLDGVHLSMSHALEEWSAHQRARLEALFARACAARCETLARRRAWDACGELAHRWLAAVPLSADAALFRLNALKAPGTPDADRQALAEYERIVARLALDFGRAPDPAVVTLADAIAARCAASPPPAPDASHADSIVARPADVAADVKIESEQTDDVAPPPRQVRVRRPRLRTRVATAAALLVTLVVALGAGIATSVSALTAAHRSTQARVPIVAVVGVTDARTDTTTAWMRDGLSAMIVAKLARATAVEVVVPERLRETRQRLRVPDDVAPSAAAVQDLGTRVGATWALTGRLTSGDSTLALELTMRDVATGRVVWLDAVLAPNVLALADAAAARVLAAAGAAGPGPRLADVETASLDAFTHYARSIRARTEGRADEQLRELDAAIAVDSGFVTALRDRYAIAARARDAGTTVALSAAFRRDEARMTDWDRLTLALAAAFHGGERERSEALGQALVARYPHDPRAYDALRDVYVHHGEWARAEEAALAQLRLDSLPAAAGDGPCVPCAAYRSLADVRLLRGDIDGAIATLRRLLVLEPGLPDQWIALSAAEAAAQRYPQALEDARHARALSGDAPVDAEVQEGRVLVAMRRFADAESLVTRWRDDGTPDARDAAAELTVTLARERGLYRDADAEIRAMVRTHPAWREMALLLGDGLGRLGDDAAARRTFEDAYHRQPAAERTALSTAGPLVGDQARAFCWYHALEADAVGARADTRWLRAIADSIEEIGARSYYARDWRLHHHVRGLVAMRGGRYADAAREFAAARWGAAGWTRSTYELARADLALGRADDAIAALRSAYSAPLDGMGRYATRAELDALMARAFSTLGRGDSAATYAARASAARGDAGRAYASAITQDARRPAALR